jgi:hypothetical protein
MEVRMSHRPLLFLALGLLIVFLAFSAACGGDDDDEATVTTTAAGTGTALPDETGSPLDSGNLPTEEEAVAFFEQAFETLNDGDVADFIVLFSDKGLAEYTGDTVTPTEQLREESLETLAGGPTITVISVQDIEPFQKNVGVVVNTTQDDADASEYFELLPYGDSYLIDAYERGTTEG